MIRITAISQNLCTNDMLKQLLLGEEVIVEKCYNDSIFLPALVKKKPNIILWDIDIYNYYGEILSNIYKNSSQNFKIIFLISNEDKRRNLLKKTTFNLLPHRL